MFNNFYPVLTLSLIREI